MTECSGGPSSIASAIIPFTSQANASDGSDTTLSSWEAFSASSDSSWPV